MQFFQFHIFGITLEGLSQQARRKSMEYLKVSHSSLINGRHNILRSLYINLFPEKILEYEQIETPQVMGFRLTKPTVLSLK